jgi:hypothetical protein
MKERSFLTIAGIGFVACLSSVAASALAAPAPPPPAQKPKVPMERRKVVKTRKRVQLILRHGQQSAWMLENAFYDEGNKDENGDQEFDNRPDFRAGDRIVLPRPNEPSALTPVTLELNGSGAGRWKLEYPRNFKMWRVVKTRTYKARRGELSDIVMLPCVVNLLIEGIEATDPDKPATLRAVILSRDSKTLATDSIPVEIAKNGGMVSTSGPMLDDAGNFVADRPSDASVRRDLGK